MSCQIRRIHLGEADRLRDIRLRALSESPSAFGTTFAADSERPPAHWEELTAAWSEGDDGAVFVADAGAQWVGIAVGARRADYLGFVAPAGTVHLTSMWVAPESRGAGLGRQLLDEVVAWAGATGARVVELWVTCGNDAAHSLYRRAGFSPLDERRPLASDSRFEIERMVLTLPDRPA
jgi:ribosomal protein S18 acetylase RimI-like enzyme